MSGVILGMPGPWSDNKCEPSDHYTTKIGGLPDWPFLKTSLAPDLLLCSACGSNTCQVAQIYAPISNATTKIEERTIYVFSCISLKCGSYSTIRVQKSDAADDVAPSSVSSSAVSGSLQLNDNKILDLDDQEHTADDEGLDLEKLRMAFSQAAITLTSATKQTTAKKSKASEKCLGRNPKFREVDSHSLVLPCFYAYDEVEKSSKDVLSISASNSSLSVKGRPDEKDDHAQEEAWEEESYEYDRALNADRTYLKFKKRMDAYPLQCFRYALGGKPLLATRELGGPGTCDVCGGSRHFEMQLLSPLLYFLHEVVSGREKELLDSWNWMTLFVYTCSKNCSNDAGPDGWTIAREAVVAQVEGLASSE